MKVRPVCPLFLTLALASACLTVAQAQNPDTQTQQKYAPLAGDAVLGAKDVGTKLFPDKVFFRGNATAEACVTLTVSSCWRVWWTIPDTPAASAKNIKLI